MLRLGGGLARRSRWSFELISRCTQRFVCGGRLYSCFGRVSLRFGPEIFSPARSLILFLCSVFSCLRVFYFEEKSEGVVTLVWSSRRREEVVVRCGEDEGQERLQRGYGGRVQ